MLFLPRAVVSSVVARVSQSCKLVRATGCSERCLVIAHSLVCSLLFSLKLTWKPRSLSMLLFCLDLGGWRSQEVLLDIYLFDYLLKFPLPLVRPVKILPLLSSPLLSRHVPLYCAVLLDNWPASDNCPSHRWRSAAGSQTMEPCSSFQSLD